MSFLWSAKPTETRELKRGSCPSALTLQLKFPVDLATGCPIVSENQQVGGCQGPAGRMFQLIYNRSRILSLPSLLVNWDIIWIKYPLSFLNYLFPIDFLIADSSNSFWTRSPQATNNSLERFARNRTGKKTDFSKAGLEPAVNSVKLECKILMWL